MPALPLPLTPTRFRRQVRLLAQADPELAAVVAAHGAPPFWVRPAGFPTLLHIILEQQVSLASAQAAFDRLNALAAPLTPAALLALGDEALRSAGLSRQKMRYCRIAAHAVQEGSLDLEALETLPDDTVRTALTALTGIGPWTADIYLQMALRRPDVWPVGDLGLQTAVQRLRGLDVRPKPAELAEIGEAWRPYRTAASGILWHGLLNWPG